jgi:hypothetical protein
MKSYDWKVELIAKIVFSILIFGMPLSYLIQQTIMINRIGDFDF